MKKNPDLKEMELDRPPPNTEISWNIDMIILPEVIQ